MAIRVKCRGCNSTLQLRDELAGKRVKCPKCAAPVEVGGRQLQPKIPIASGERTPPPIGVTCHCGQKFRAKAELAGRRVKCPACGQALAIPASEAAAAIEPLDELDLEGLLGADAGATAAPHALHAHITTRRKGPNLRLIIGLSVGAGAALLVLLLGIALWPPGRDKPLTEVGAAPGKGSPPNAGGAERNSTAQGPRDAKPPFDLDEFLETPPDEENAAPLYLDALVEFDESCFLLSPESEAEYRRRDAIVKQRRDERQRLDDAWEKDPKSVDGAAVDTWLKHYDVGFQKLAVAQQRPRCVFETDLRIDSLHSHVHVARNVARIAVWRTRRNVERGDLDRPIEDLQTVLRLSRDLRPRGDLSSQLVSIAMEGICCRQIVPAILTAPSVETRHCDRLVALLAEHEAESVDSYSEGLRAEYIRCRSGLDDFQHPPGDSEAQQRREYASWLDIRRDRVEEFLHRIGSMTDDDYANEVDNLNRLIGAILALEDQTARERLKGREAMAAEITSTLGKTTLLGFLFPAFGVSNDAILRSEATLRGTQCLVALRRWQLQHGELPRDLDRLVRTAGMPGVPIDPYADQPLQMTVIGRDPVIYSVGPDGQDDKGLLDCRAGTQPGDFIFRYEPPSGQEQIIAEIKKLGGTVEIGDWRPDRPVFGVSLARTPVTDDWLEHLKGMTSLQQLSLQNTRVTDAGLEHLGGLISLGQLSLQNTKITDAGLEYVKGLPHLGRLFLDNTQVTDAALEHLQGLTTLGGLFLSSTQVTDAALEHLRGLTVLSRLFLSGTQVTDAGLENLKGLSSLRWLLLNDTRVTDAGLEHLKGLTGLQHLSLSNTRVTGAGVLGIKKALPKLRIIR